MGNRYIPRIPLRQALAEFEEEQQEAKSEKRIFQEIEISWIEYNALKQARIAQEIDLAWEIYLSQRFFDESLDEDAPLHEIEIFFSESENDSDDVTLTSSRIEFRRRENYLHQKRTDENARIASKNWAKRVATDRQNHCGKGQKKSRTLRAIKLAKRASKLR